MIINIRDLLTLDDHNEYVVASKVTYENKFYYYIIDINNPKNLKICYQENNEIIELNDNKIIMKLLPLFAEVINKEN